MKLQIEFNNNDNIGRGPMKRQIEFNNNDDNIGRGQTLDPG